MEQRSPLVWIAWLIWRLIKQNGDIYNVSSLHISPEGDTKLRWWLPDFLRRTGHLTTSSSCRSAVEATRWSKVRPPPRLSTNSNKQGACCCQRELLMSGFISVHVQLGFKKFARIVFPLVCVHADSLDFICQGFWKIWLSSKIRWMGFLVQCCQQWKQHLTDWMIQEKKVPWGKTFSCYSCSFFVLWDLSESTKLL